MTTNQATISETTQEAVKAENEQKMTRRDIFEFNLKEINATSDARGQVIINLKGKDVTLKNNPAAVGAFEKEFGSTLDADTSFAKNHANLEDMSRFLELVTADGLSKEEIQEGIIGKGYFYTLKAVGLWALSISLTGTEEISQGK